jgi:hypothetical protein
MARPCDLVRYDRKVDNLVVVWCFGSILNTSNVRKVGLPPRFGWDPFHLCACPIICESPPSRGGKPTFLTVSYSFEKIEDIE